MPQIQFWFEYASTYSYLSAMRIEDAASAHGIDVVWQPFLLGPIFAAQGWDNSPFNLYPAKGRYMWRDMERLCAERSLPFAKPENFPQNGILASRVTLAIADQTKVGAFVRAVYSAQFAKAEDISDASVISDCLQEADLPTTLISDAKRPDIKQALFAQVEKAQKLDIFGAPSFIANGDLFWGDDRLDQALRACQ